MSNDDELNYLIRPMTKDDIDDVIQGELSVFNDTLGRDYLLQELEINPFSCYLVLEINEKVSGYVGLQIEDNMQINNLYVAKEYQGLGFGSMLMDFVLDLCLSTNVKSLTLEVRPSNTIAINLYTKYGLKEVSRRKNYYNNGEDAILMQRSFTEGK